MKHKILVVEDDQYFREALCDGLKKHYDVLQAPNGKSAKEILSFQTVHLVLSDIQMPGFTGLELLEWSKENKPVPFILMTGFSMVLETQNAFSLGAKGFIAKPFKNIDLLSTIKEVLGIKDEANEKKFPVVDINNTYCRVSINEFVAKPKIDFDVYIKLSETKIVKIAHKGEEIPKNKVEHYKEKGVKYLHILKEDFNKLVEFNINVAKIIKNRTDVSSMKKANFMKYTGEILLEQVFIQGLNKESFDDAKSFLDVTMSTVVDEKENLDLLSILQSHSDHIYAHSLGVSMYSVMIAKKMDFEGTTALFKLSMAGLFHDIGKKEIDREVLEKPRHMVTKDERKLIESHVVRGQEILQAMPSTPADVIQLVFEHHEDLEGLGYPLGKQKFELHPLSKIIQCANIFIDLTLPSPNYEPKKPLDAIDYMIRLYGKRIDPACIAALKKLF